MVLASSLAVGELDLQWKRMSWYQSLKKLRNWRKVLQELLIVAMKGSTSRWFSIGDIMNIERNVETFCYSSWARTSLAIGLAAWLHLQTIISYNLFDASDLSQISLRQVFFEFGNSGHRWIELIDQPAAVHW